MTDLIDSNQVGILALSEELYLRRAVDHEGEVLEVFVTKR